jgi:cytochrome c oxidase assembly protein subunit 15
VRRLPRLPPRKYYLSPRSYRRITLVALLALGFIIVTGAAVRLTGSGLGCTEWPACTEDRFVAEADYHQMIEFVNRAITGFVSLAVILAVLGSLVRVPRRRDLTWWSLGLVAGVIAQIILGGMVVLLHLTPVSVIGHFLLSIVLVWNATVLYDRAGHPGTPGQPMVGPRVVWLGRATVAAALVVVVAGTMVTATGPHGGDDRADRLSFDISAVARNHGIAAWVLLALVVATLWLAYREGASPLTRRRGAWLAALVVAQGALGYTQYFTGVPPLLVGVHVLGAVAVWTMVLLVHLSLFAHPEPTPGVATDPSITDRSSKPEPAGATLSS